MIQVVTFAPANLIFAGFIGTLIEGKNSWMMGVIFLLPAFLVAWAICVFFAMLLAGLVCRVKQPVSRNILAGVLGLMILSLAWLPIYGSGGHGPMRWQDLATFSQEYGLDYWLHVFPVMLLILLAHLGYRRTRLNTKPGSEHNYC
jgi:hypothetical protein